MPTPVVFEIPTFDDFANFVPDEEQERLINSIEDRLGNHPHIGRALPPPQAFARSHKFLRWRVYYELVYDDEDVEKISKASVLRIVPAQVRFELIL
jgi:hypothetical protein